MSAPREAADVSAPEKDARAENATARELRRAFDASFAVPARGRVADVERLLRLHFGADGYALRLADIGGLSAARKIVPIDSAIPEVLGLAGIRGNLVPVYSLSMLLGYGTETEPPRWFVACGSSEPIAFGFASLDGYVELPTTAVHAGNAPRQYVHALARVIEQLEQTDKEAEVNQTNQATMERTIAVIDVAALMHAISLRAKEP